MPQITTSEAQLYNVLGNLCKTWSEQQGSRGVPDYHLNSRSSHQPLLHWITHPGTPTTWSQRTGTTSDLQEKQHLHNVMVPLRPQHVQTCSILSFSFHHIWVHWYITWYIHSAFHIVKTLKELSIENFGNIHENTCSNFCKEIRMHKGDIIPLL